jgi:acyl-coenzyme A thioesterase PaaI-like protein
MVRLPAPVLRVPTWREIGGDPTLMRRFLNVWPPFRFAGIRVLDIRPGFTGATVALRLRPLTRNYVGTQFGGAMFMMADPFWMLLLMRQLGEDYVVWDRRAEIEFVAPGRTDVHVEFVVEPAVVQEIQAAAAGGERVLRWFESDIVDDDGAVVARVRRQLYIRRKPGR